MTTITVITTRDELIIDELSRIRDVGLSGPQRVPSVAEQNKQLEFNALMLNSMIALDTP